jgi:hypothetical protein
MSGAVATAVGGTRTGGDAPAAQGTTAATGLVGGPSVRPWRAKEHVV